MWVEYLDDAKKILCWTAGLCPWILVFDPLDKWLIDLFVSESPWAYHCFIIFYVSNKHIWKFLVYFCCRSTFFFVNSII
jgi:hypothetical protein